MADERGVEELLEQRCEACDAPLTRLEIEAAREDGRPFLCSAHAAEELPAVDPEAGAERED
ncbi:MAG: hypothetical protein ACLGHP_10090 [Vicinamibacteria bacterium]